MDRLPSHIKTSVQSGIIFFATVAILSIAYATIGSTWTSPSALEVGAGSGLTASAWNALLANFNNLDTRSPKAWVNFDGASCSPNCTIRAGYNIASVTRTAAGDYTINFSQPLSNANYATIATSYMDATDNTIRQFGAYLKATTYVKVRHIYADSSGYRGGYDYPRAEIAIFGN